MDKEQQSPLMIWIDNNCGADAVGKAREAVNLLSTLVFSVGVTSSMLSVGKDLHAHYIKSVNTAFSGLYDSGESENFDEELISVVYTHLTGKNFEDLQNEWAANMEQAIAQNRASLGLDA